MCYVCCKETRGWCKSFTRTETFLTILEGILLVVFLAFLVFLILHFIVCSSNVGSHQTIIPTIVKESTTTVKESTTTVKESATMVKEVNHTTKAPTAVGSLKPNPNYPPEKRPMNKTATPGVECTWKPSVKTTAGTRYYEYGHTSKSSKAGKLTRPLLEYNDDNYLSNEKSDNKTPDIDTSTKGVIEYRDNKYSAENEEASFNNDESEYSDGEDAEDMYKSIVLALVKIKPPSDITFGCILTIITEYWTVTAASCIESIEEVDSLDSFVMMEGYGELRHGRTHIVADVLIHPLYQGANRSYDIVALRSQDSLMRGTANAVELPNMVDYFLITIGERFIILGYGPFRTIDKSPAGRSLHVAYVFSLPASVCRVSVGDESWAHRHLMLGARVEAGAGACGGGGAPLCGGVLHARGLPCNYCAGTPLLRGPPPLRGPLLLALMSDDRHCGLACEPNIYVNVAAVRDWLDSII